MSVTKLLGGDSAAGLTGALAREALQGTITRLVGEGFRRAEERKGRDPFALSMSKLGGCSREIAYRAASTEPSDPYIGESDEKRMAWLGTWQHRGLLPLLRLGMRGSRTEVPVVLRARSSDGQHLEVPGSVDLWWRRRDGDVVVDIKTVREYGLGWVRERGPREKDCGQVDGYALALRQSHGADVRWTALVYLDRATGDSEVIVRPFGREETLAVFARLEQVIDWMGDPQGAPQTERGPGLSFLCDRCPWLRACWGPRARPGDPSVLAIDPEQRTLLQVAASDYVAARATETLAKREKEAARARLDRAQPGRYGPWEVSWGKGSEAKVDKSKSWDALIEAGVDLEALAVEREALRMSKPVRGAIGVKATSEDVGGTEDVVAEAEPVTAPRSVQLGGGAA